MLTEIKCLRKYILCKWKQKESKGSRITKIYFKFETTKDIRPLLMFNGLIEESISIGDIHISTPGHC